jgi:2',3'-cyclic-nucleotide 2'-phosphodiesterase (5'-nucleotidase family)
MFSGISIYKYIFSRFFLLLFAVILISCNRHAFISKVETNVIKIDTINVIKDDSLALATIWPYKSKMQADMDQVLAYTETAFNKNFPEGLLNNFVTDLSLLEANIYYKSVDGTKPEICLMNSGGLRATLPKGAITKGKVYELMPFNNELVVLTITGEKTKQMFDYVAKKGGIPMAGIKMGIKDTSAVNMIVGGKPFDIGKNYKIVTNDFLANGGDKMTFFNNPINKELLGVKVRDVIIEYMVEENKNGRTLKSQLDKRIYFEK